MMNRMRMLGIVLCALVAFAMASAPAKADTTYTYTGNEFNLFNTGFTCPPFCSVTGSFTVTSPLGDNLNLQMIAPTSFAFTDGSDGFTSVNSLSDFLFSTDASGNITGWELFELSSASANPFLVSEANCGGGCVVGDYSELEGTSPATYIAAIFNDPGTWKSTSTSTPEPASIMLLGTGLLGLASLRRKFKLS